MKTRVFTIIISAMIITLLLPYCGQQKKTADADEKNFKASPAIEKSDDKLTEPDSEEIGKPLGIRSGIVEYTYSGDKTGKSTQYFDDYGMKSATCVDIESEDGDSRVWTVSIGEDQYMWDPSSPDKAMKMKNPVIKMMMESSGGDILYQTAQIYEQLGLKESGTEIFKGKECIVFKGEMGKVLIWKGLMMKSELKMGEVVSRQEVTSIKTNVPVDGKYFRIPDNITFTEIPGF
ncbi:MAG: hypothetical protein QUS66_10840 [Bacteroidota bacterium]|jgi:hypothetical protein|nr:hypothetical protein [Bacteroidota bacterium]